MNLSERSLKRPVTTMMIFLCFVVVGYISSRLLPLEYFPEVDIPFINVEVPYPSSTPEEVERQITRPIEEVLATIADVKRMQSFSRDNGCNVVLEFDWGVNTDIKALEAKEKIDGIRNQIPDDIERYFVNKFSTTDMSMLALRISSKRDLSNSYDMLNRNLKRRIERIEGVSKVDLYGVDKKEIKIQLIADRLIAHKVDVSRLVTKLRQSNFQITSGKITDGNRRFAVRPIGEFTSVNELKEVIIGEKSLRLKDIAKVTYKHPKLNYGRHLDKKYAIGLDVFKESGANTVDVANRVIEEIEKAGKNPEMQGVNIFYMENLGEGITSSLNELLKSGMIGALFAVIILFFFLRHLTTTFMVTLAVPFSLLATMAAMYFLDISLNILSMMGLMLAVGMLVDNAVVVTESIHRHRKINPDKKAAILAGTKEVSLAITAGTLTTAIVFLPNIVSQSDQVAVWMKHVATALVIALGASLVLAQTIIPLLAARLKAARIDKESKSVEKLTGIYGNILGWTLNHRKLTVLFIVLILFSIAVPMSLVKMDMFDDPEDRRLRLHFHINGNYTLERVESTVDIVEDYLYSNQDKFEIESVYTYFQPGYAQSTIMLKKGDEVKKTQQEIQDEIREGLPKLAIANPTFDWRRAGGGGESIGIQLVGKSSELLAGLSREMAWTLKQIPGFTDVRSAAERGDKEVHVVVDRMKAKRYGFSTQQIASVVSGSLRGVNLRRLKDEDGEIDVRLEFQEDDRQTLENLRELTLFNQNNNPVKLATLANFVVRRGPRTIRRENRITSMFVNINLKDVTVNDAKKKISEVLKNFNMPAGYFWNYGESFNFEDEALNTMLLNLLLALALIYFVMAALFESLVFPGAIWSSILFAIVGVYWFFLITGTTMSIMGMIGILILIGVVVNNGIVLIDYINQLRSRGIARDEAILKAGRYRLRPILMTAGTTILSLVPLCIVTTQIGGDGPPYFPMARAIVGGLAFSTIITLLILPTIYILLDDMRNWARMVIVRAK